MAKQPVNVVERHLEKAVLGLCAAVLLASIVVYLVSTPNKIDLGNEQVGAEAIDLRIRDAGRRLRDRLQNAEPMEVEVEDWVAPLKAASSPLELASLSAELRRPTPWLPPVPDIGEAPPRAGEIKLARVIAPSRPMVTTGRSGLDLVPPTRLGESSAESEGEIPWVNLADVNWVTVAAVFDQQRQISVCKKAGYNPGRQNPYLVGVDLQRREQQPDGSYSEWADIEAYMPAVLPDLPEVEIVPGRKGPIPTKPTRDRVSEFFNARLRKHQVDLFRPMFPARKHGDNWEYATFAEIDLAALDQEFCNKPNNEQCDPRPYAVQAEAEEEERPKSDRELIQEALIHARSLLDQGLWADARRAADAVLRMPGITSADQREVERITELAEQGQQDEATRRRTPRSSDKEDVPTERRRSRYQIVWAHDAAPEVDGGAASGKTYQYRMRIRLYNRYCAIPSDLADSDDAKRVFVVGEWSEPTAEVVIPSDTQFFLTSGNPSLASGAKVTIYKWYEGVWVKHTFRAVVGAHLGGQAREQVGQLPGGRPDRPQIDFSTGATVVDIDYDYMFRPKKRRGRRGFTIEPPKPTVALVYADASGELRQRILAADRTSAEHKSFKDRVATFRPPRR